MRGPGEGAPGSAPPAGRARALLALLALALACRAAPRGWDPEVLGGALAPPASLAALAWSVPFPAVRGRAVDLLLCRWPDGARVPVAGPRELAPDRRAELGLVLAQLETALGLRLPLLAVDSVEEAAIEIRHPERLQEGRGPVLGDTVADCALRPAATEGDAETTPHLVHASVHLAERRPLRGGGTRALEAPERVGLLLHELGHALGFSGHVGPGHESVMRTDRGTLAELGAALLAGETLALPALRALYATPTGSVVGTLELPASGRQRYAGLHERAAREGWVGPFARSGDRSARIGWRDAEGGVQWLVIDDWPRRVRQRAPVLWRRRPSGTGPQCPVPEVRLHSSGPEARWLRCAPSP